MQKTVLSTKGQVVIPVDIRNSENWKAGKEFVVKKTHFGILLIEIPKDPIKALRGIAKGMNITDEEIKEMRRKDDLHDKAELGL